MGVDQSGFHPDNRDDNPNINSTKHAPVIDQLKQSNHGIRPPHAKELQRELCQRKS